MIQNVSAKQAKEWLESSQAILIDVREPAEYRSEHIGGAVLLPLAKVTASSLPEHEGKKLIFQCRSGKRGGMACDKLKDFGNGESIYNLDGGIMAWIEAGYGVERSKQFFLPVDQQTQLVIGLCVLCGSILAYTVHPAFLLLTGFFGFGLTLAGLTGFCGLAILLSKMPWNQVHH